MRAIYVSRRQTIMAVTVVIALTIVAVMLYAWQRRDAYKRAAPAWLDPQQPPDGVAASLPTLTAAQSWAANRATPMSASCAGNTAGTRVRREYPANLVEAPYSLVRAAGSFQIGGN